MKKRFMFGLILIGFGLGAGVCAYLSATRRDVALIHYRSEIDIKNEQIEFITRLIEQGGPLTEKYLLSILDENDISYAIHPEDLYVYVSTKFMVFRFDKQGNLSSLVPQK